MFSKYLNLEKAIRCESIFFNLDYCALICITELTFSIFSRPTAKLPQLFCHVLSPIYHKQKIFVVICSPGFSDLTLCSRVY